MSRKEGRKMSAINCATCPECGKGFSWLGKLIDKPNCPYCGRVPDREKLANLETEIERAIDEIKQRGPSDAGRQNT